MSRKPALYVIAVSLLGCADMHGVGGGDAGTVSCESPAPFSCASSCASDALARPLCVDDAWRCPPEAPIDTRTCSGCTGVPPEPSCVCEGRRWVCGERACPPDVNLWDPDDPANACSVEGATCGSGGSDDCSAAVFCRCEDGRWRCAIADPDPVCWCEREPEVGDPCDGSVTSCGQCCPTAEGPNWPAMTCVDGSWQPADCPEVACPPVHEQCPVVPEDAVGQECFIDGQACGSSCCGDAIVCVGGRWERGPEADCACVPGARCGEGRCYGDQYCRQGCAPDDGPLFHCVTDADGCTDCSCLPLESWQRCEMVDGRPRVTRTGCG